MNREQRRKKIKELQKNNNLTREQALEIVQAKIKTSTHLFEGVKVKLNYKEITAHPDWQKINPKLKAFVEENKDNVFTVEYDLKKKESNSKDKDILVCLKEDTNEPKWLFYTSDLIICDEQ